MPRTGWRKSESDRRLPDLVSVGLLMKVFPAEVVDAVITECDRTEKRRRSLPARSMAYFAMGMALHSEGSYEDVLAMISDGLAWAAREPVGDHRQHVLVGALGVKRHPHREVRHRPGRQGSPPLLRPVTLSDHRVHHLRGENLHQQTHRHQIRQPPIRLGLPPTGTGHANKLH